jgi:acyl-CoA synthetase (AMP-forming)/AMP-acid ligase II
VRASLLSSPNFGYRHYLKALGDRDVTGLDLASVRIIFNGAEPISVALCEEFTTRLAPAGLSPCAMYPVYGLAEASLAVTFPPLGRALETLTIDRTCVRVGQPVTPISADALNAVTVVSEGCAIEHCHVRIVDDDGSEVTHDRVGHIEISGANVTAGYLANDEATTRAFTPDGWLRTGDLGFMHAGELFVSGRAKDVILADGLNIHAHDIENIVCRLTGIEAGRVAAAAVRRFGNHQEQLAVFVVHRGEPAAFVPVVRQISQVLSEHAGVRAVHVVPVKRIPKTTSGKMQRVKLAGEYADGAFDDELATLCRCLAADHAVAFDPESEIERRLATIIASILPGRAVGREENVFAIGATSLNLMEIYERIDREYPGAVSLANLFQLPTVASLATHIGAWRESPPHDS